jgi:hypothetical protein
VISNAFACLVPGDFLGDFLLGPVPLPIGIGMSTQVASPSVARIAQIPKNMAVRLVLLVIAMWPFVLAALIVRGLLRMIF